uniref:Adenylate kinase 5, like n=1 Tax=Erpetoichthys calabaricus TaxID=27687 RepID=A0A8C4T0B8_ERPCA
MMPTLKFCKVPLDLLQSMLTGLMYYRPEDPLAYLENCLQRTRELGGPEHVRWDTFITQDRRSLPPINGGPNKKPVFRPDVGPGPYRRYERLPPIQTQFSIESDSDMKETSGLIQEYDVFDPTKPRPHIIFVVGGPGSGKGTQSSKMAQRYGYTCISVGEILRNQLLQHATSDRKWELIAQIIANGELAPQETTIEELKHQFIKNPDAKGFVVDGFPREIAQAFTFEEQIGSPDLVVFLACSSTELRERLERRAAQQGRPDDNTHAIERRLDTFKQNISLIAKYYQERALIVRIDADREEDDIFASISAVVEERLFPNGLQAKGGCP